MSYFFGFLPLDSNRSWLLHNTDVDAHLYNRLAELPDATAYFIGFENGDWLSTTRLDSGEFTFAVCENNDMWTYNTASSSTHNKAMIRDQPINHDGYYDAAARSW